MAENSASKPFDRIDYLYKMMIILGITVTVVILLSDIVIPMAFGAFLSVVMLPLVKRLERKMGTVWSILLVLFATIIVIGLLTWLVVEQIIGLLNDLPNLQSQLMAFIQNISTRLAEDFGVSLSEQNRMLQDSIKSVSRYLGDILLGTGATLGVLVQIPIYIFLFLIYRHKFAEFFKNLVRKESGNTWQQEIENVIQGYILGLTFVTLIIAALNTIGLVALGIDHAIFFGILSGVLTIIPYVGIIIGGLFPVLMALITKDSIWYAVGVVGVFAVVQFLEGNFITPRVTGSKVSINALAAIIALLIGGKILGIAGMILAIPAIGVIKIILSYSTHLKPFVILLEDEQKLARNRKKSKDGKNDPDKKEENAEGGEQRPD